MMHALGPQIVVGHVEPPNPIDVAREQLSADLREELMTLGQRIVDTGMNDELTGRIIDWKERFVALLDHHVHPREVLRTSVDSLQQDILVDPCFAGVPYDEHTLYGITDGEAYNWQALYIYQTTEPRAELRGRSPWHPDDPTPLQTDPHHVVRLVIEWLDRRQIPRMHSEDLNRAYLEIIRREQAAREAEQARPPRMSAEQRIAAIQAEQQQIRDAEAGQRRVDAENLDDELAARLRNWGVEMAQMAVPQPEEVVRQREVGAAIEEAAARQQEERNRVGANIDRAIEAGRVRRVELGVAIMEAGDQRREAMEDLVQQNQALDAREQANRVEFQAEVQQVLQQGVMPIARVIEQVHQEAVQARVDPARNQQLQGLQRLQQAAKQEAAQMEREAEQYKKEQQETRGQINECEQHTAMLEQSVREAKAAAAAAMDARTERLINAIAIVGACAIGSWAIANAMAEFEFTLGTIQVVPSQQGLGAALRPTINF